MKKTQTVLIKIFRLLAVVFIVGIIAAYLFVPFSDMPEGIRSFVTLLKHSLNVKGNPPLILLILWFALLIAEIPFALEVKAENNVFADDQRYEEIKTIPAEKKKKELKTKTEKKPSKGKTAEKQNAWETAKVGSRKPAEKKPTEKKAVEKKPAEKKKPEVRTAGNTIAQKPVRTPEKAVSKSAAAQSRPAKAAAAVSRADNAKTVRTKAPYEPVKEKQKPYDDESFDKFLQDLKQDYLNK